MRYYSFDNYVTSKPVPLKRLRPDLDGKVKDQDGCPLAEALHTGEIVKIRNAGLLLKLRWKLLTCFSERTRLIVIVLFIWTVYVGLFPGIGFAVSASSGLLGLAVHEFYVWVRRRWR